MANMRSIIRAVLRPFIAAALDEAFDQGAVKLRALTDEELAYVKSKIHDVLGPLGFLYPEK